MGGAQVYQKKRTISEFNSEKRSLQINSEQSDSSNVRGVEDHMLINTSSNANGKKMNYQISKHYKNVNMDIRLSLNS